MAALLYVVVLAICTFSATLQMQQNVIGNIQKRMARFPTDLRLSGKLLKDYLKNFKTKLFQST